MLLGGISNSYITFNGNLYNDNQKTLYVKQTPFAYGYGYGYGSGADYFDVLDIAGDYFGWGINGFEATYSNTYGYGYGYERLSNTFDFVSSAYIDEIYINNLGAVALRVAFENSNAIAEGKYYKIPANTCVGPIHIKIKNAIYVQRDSNGASEYSIIGTTSNKF